MSIFNSFDISASGMTVQRLRTDVIANNIANVDTTSTSDGGAYVRQTVVVAEKESTSFSSLLSKATGTYSGSGVKATAIVEDTETEMNMVYEPDNPDADEDGYVEYPNVNVVTEMTNMIDASRSYEANVTAFTASKEMAVKGLEIAE